MFCGDFLNDGWSRVMFLKESEDLQLFLLADITAHQPEKTKDDSPCNPDERNNISSAISTVQSKVLVNIQRFYLTM